MRSQHGTTSARSSPPPPEAATRYPGDGIAEPPAPAIGAPVTFSSGPFAQQTLRTELRVLQEALFCRKASPRDRRPLEPPPVLTIVLHRILADDDGDPTEVEIADYRSIPYVGFITHVDIFEVPQDLGTAAVFVPPQNIGDPNVYATIGGQPLTESALATSQLAGSTFSSALTLPIADTHALVSVFYDLSCRKEGTFVPRYRCTYVESPAFYAAEFPVLAEVWGRAFRVYSTAEQPTLPASTDLTKELLRLGVPVHARAKETSKRKRGKKVATGSSASDELPTDGDDSGGSL